MERSKSNKNSSNFFERNPRVTLLAFNLIIFALLLGGLEFYLNKVNKREDWMKNVRGTDRTIKLIEYAPLINTTVYPTDEYIKKTNAKNLEQKQYIFRTDSSGCIMPSDVYKNPDFRIAFLGGSTTECFFVEEQNRFPAYVGRSLSDRTGKKINTYNFAVSGMTSMASNNIMLNKVIPFDVDIAIKMHNINDLSTLYYTGTYWNQSNRTLLAKKGKNTLLDWTKDQIKQVLPNIYSLVKNAVFVQDQDEWADYRDFAAEVEDQFVLNQFKASLKTFINICRAWEIKPVIMTQPNRFPITEELLNAPFYQPTDYSRYRDIYLKMNDIIRQTANEKEVLLIELEQSVPKDTLHLIDLVHLNDQGSIRAGDVITDSLEYFIQTL